jgi:hypothetical protein
MKTLVKTKIVLIDNGSGLMTLIWKPYLPYLFPNIFGYWEAGGTCSCYGKLGTEHLTMINDNNVARVIFDNFISPKPKNYQLLLWLKERVATTQKEKDALGTSTPDELKQRCGKGGKLRAFKEALAYVETHS